MEEVKKNKGGRPKKENKANKTIFVNITEEQKERIEQAAENMGLSSSGFIKYLLSKEGII